MKMLRILRLLLAKNGWIWTALFVTNTALRKLFGHESVRLNSGMAERERRLGLPGWGDLTASEEIWNSWDWSRGGEEWTPSEEWKRSLVRYLMEPLARGERVLEIGPGGGRWSVELAPLASRLILVDISERCIEVCRQRLKDFDHVEFHVNDGQALGGVGDGSVSAVWSFDVFVHLAPDVVAGYLAEIARVLEPGGHGLIHHGGDGGLSGGFRSRVTADDFAEMLAAHGLVLEEQFDRWGEANEFGVEAYGDVISRFVRASRQR